ncbi:MAG: hypothetical protein ACI4X9_03325 [Kiritimatiellia bacterium]
MIPILATLLLLGTASPRDTEADRFLWDRANALICESVTNAPEAAALYRQLDRPGSAVHYNLFLATYLSGDYREAHRELLALEALSGSTPETDQALRATAARLGIPPRNRLETALARIPLERRLEAFAAVWCGLFLLLALHLLGLKRLTTLPLILANLLLLGIATDLVRTLKAIAPYLLFLCLLPLPTFSATACLATDTPEPLVGLPCEVRLELHLAKGEQLDPHNPCTLAPHSNLRHLTFEALPVRHAGETNIYSFAALYTPTSTTPETLLAPLRVRLIDIHRRGLLTRYFTTVLPLDPPPLRLRPRPANIPQDYLQTLGPVTIQATLDTPETAPGSVHNLTLDIHTEAPLPEHLQTHPLNLTLPNFKTYPPRILAATPNRLTLSYPIVATNPPPQTLTFPAWTTFHPAGQNFQTIAVPTIPLTPAPKPNLPPQPQPLKLRLAPNPTAPLIATFPPNTPLPKPLQTTGPWQRVQLGNLTGWLQP